MKWLLFVIATVAIGGAQTVAQELPPEILADQYLLEATRALENGEPETAIQAFLKIEALDTEPPQDYVFYYGKLLVEHGESRSELIKGQSLLKQYVLSIAKDSEHYKPTLELLSSAGTKLKVSRGEVFYSRLLDLAIPRPSKRSSQKVLM